MATYNRENTLSRAIDSILAQTIMDFEFIIVDDGSTDSSPQLLKDYARRDKRIKIVTQKNQGLAVARNKGVDKASAKYIAFMDSDDACAINRLEIQIDFLKKYPHYSACSFHGLHSITDYYPGVRSSRCYKHISCSGRVFLNVYPFTVLGPHSLITRESFMRLGGYRHQKTIVEDLDFTLRYSNFYAWGSIGKQLGGYFYTSPEDNKDEGLMKDNILRFAKLVVASFISEWCRFTNAPDPVEQNNSLEEILAIVPDIPWRQKLVIYRNISYLGSPIYSLTNMSKQQARFYLLSLLFGSLLQRSITFAYYKLRKFLAFS